MGEHYRAAERGARMCTRCGVLVADEPLHDDFHAGLDKLVKFARDMDAAMYPGLSEGPEF